MLFLSILQIAVNCQKTLVPVRKTATSAAACGCKCLVAYDRLPQDLGIGASHEIIGMIYIVAADVTIPLDL